MEFMFYKLAHLIGIMLLFSGLVGLLFAVHAAAPNPISRKVRVLANVGHGLGLLLILVSGLGMLGDLASVITRPALWVIGKVIIFLAFGVAVSFAKRKPQTITYQFAVYILLGGLAAYLALYKPL